MFFPTSTRCCLKPQYCAGLKPQPCCAAQSRPVPSSSPQRVPGAPPARLPSSPGPSSASSLCQRRKQSSRNASLKGSQPHRPGLAQGEGLLPSPGHGRGSGKPKGSIAQQSSAQPSTAWLSIAQHGSAQPSSAQHSTGRSQPQPAPSSGWGRSKHRTPPPPGAARSSLTHIHWELEQGTGQDKAIASPVPRSVYTAMPKGTDGKRVQVTFEYPSLYRGRQPHLPR